MRYLSVAIAAAPRFGYPAQVSMAWARLRLAGTLLAFTLVVTSTAVTHARPSLDSARLARLAAYDVLAFTDPFAGGLERGKAIGVFDATPEEVFRVASDYAKWKDYLPRVRGSRVISYTPSQALVEMVADLPWPAGRSEVWARYTEEKLPGQIYRIRFDMVRGSMKKYLGSIYIEPWSPGKAALTYQLVAEPGIFAPDSLVNRSVRRTAIGFVNALRQRINDLHRSGWLHPLEAPERRRPLSAPITPDSVKAKLVR